MSGHLSWFNSRQQTRTTQSSLISPARGLGGESGEWKPENSWVEVMSAQQGKQKLCTQAKQNKEFIHYFPWAGRFSAIPRKEGLHHILAVTGKNELPQQTPFLVLPLHLVLYFEHDTIRSGISLFSAGDQHSRLCPLQGPCAPPALSLVGWDEEQKRAWLCVRAAQQ